MSSDRVICRTIKNLRASIAHHEHAYRILLEPEITDTQFDELRKLLVELEVKHPECVGTNSTGASIGSDRVGVLPAVQHVTPMLSLDYTSDVDRVHALVDSHLVNFPQNVPHWRVAIEHKLDGMAVSLTYKSGKLVSASSRGDGEVGEDITANVLLVTSVPKQITATIDLEVRGEVVVYRAHFDDYNQQALNEGAKSYSNPRAMAAAAMRTGDHARVRKMKPTFIAYEAFTNDWQVDQQPLMLEMLRLEGFHAVKAFYARQPSDVDMYLSQILADRVEYPYDIDGAVIKLTSYDERQSLGVTSSHPRWALAFKYPAVEAYAKITAVVYQTGRTGAITPVVKVEPTPLGPITVASVTLHNLKILERMQIRIGDIAVIRRANDVVPQFVKALPREQGEPVVPATVCADCQSPLVALGRTGLKCPNNLSCPAQVIATLCHFVGSAALDIDGFAETRISWLVSAGVLSSPADFFRLTAVQLSHALKCSMAYAERLVVAISTARYTTLPRLLHGLGIEGIGTIGAREIARYFHYDLEEILHAKESEFARVPGLDKRRAPSVERYFAANYEAVKDLISCGLSWPVTQPMPKETHGPLDDQTLLVTGRVVDEQGQAVTRTAVYAYYRNLGAKIADRLNSHVSVLITGERPAIQKINAATILEVPVTTYQMYARKYNLPPFTTKDV